MNETQTIIVGSDGSAAANTAVAWAADEAVRYGRPLRIVHVEDPWVYGLHGSPSTAFAQELRARSEHVLDTALAAVAEDRNGLVVTAEHLSGDPVRILRDLAALGIELVLGKRGRGAFADLLLGSTSLRVAGHTTRPVVVVNGGPSPSRGEVVVGVALDHDPAAVLSYAFTAARARNARLRAIHVWDVSDSFVPLIKNDAAYVDPLDRLADLLAPWRERNGDVKVVEEMVTDQPVAVLSEASAAADLLVVGTHGRGSLGTALLGSVGHGVLHHAHCPVAVVPAG